MYQYHMPTKLLFGKNCVRENAGVFSNYGKKAFIITGKSSAKNGSLDDVTAVLNSVQTSYVIFDDVKENPSIDNVESAAEIGKKEAVDFIIAIGGGSVLDAAKSAGFLIRNPKKCGQDLLEMAPLLSIPLIAVPTTAGTGSEVTPFSILTIHSRKTKQSVPHRVFFEFAFLDASYMDSMPVSVTLNTALDAMTHLIESYLSAHANPMSQAICESGLRLFAECIDALRAQSFTPDIREKLLLTSTIGGIAIAQTATSLPHLLGYPLTYYHDIPHGKANAILTKEYLNCFVDQSKVNNLLSLLSFESLDNFGAFLCACIGSVPSISSETVRQYSQSISENKTKLKNHPEPIDTGGIMKIYQKSLT